MRVRISPHMNLDENACELILWDWVMEAWEDDQEPPWRNPEARSQCGRSPLPVTWIAGETIHLGYGPPWSKV